MPIKCMVCGSDQKRISHAHAKMHGLSVAEYMANYPDAPTVSPETKAVLSAAQKVAQGRPEVRAKISKSCAAVVKTPEWNRKNGEGQKYRSPTQESREKMSTSAKAAYERGDKAINTPELKDRIREIQKTDEYKLALAQGQAESYAKGHFNGLNDRTEKLLIALGLTGTTEFLVGYARFDFAFPEKKVLVEVMGCRWHYCPQCPKAWVNRGESEEKMHRLAVDKSKRTYAKNRGWTVIDLWEHDYPPSDHDAQIWLKTRLVDGGLHVD